MAARARRTPTSLRVAPVDADNWQDCEALFAARGAPHYCWCSIYRFDAARSFSKPEKRAALRGLVQSGTPIGLLAYAGDAPIGWCSAAPRESYLKLARSRSMPRVSEAPTWTVLCFFVQRVYRGAGVVRALLAGAVEEARCQGARVIEGYPHDTAGTSATHRGSSHVFRALGFQQDGSRWFLELPPARRRRKSPLRAEAPRAQATPRKKSSAAARAGRAAPRRRRLDGL